MKRRSAQDLVKQGVSERRSLKIAKFPRPFNQAKVIQKKVLARTIIVAPSAISVFKDDYDDSNDDMDFDSGDGDSFA